LRIISKIMWRILIIVPGLYTILNFMGVLLLKLNRVVGSFYSKMCGRFGVTWFDHRFDYFRGPENWYWYERGILGHRVINPGDTVLDVCCGDGIFSGLFYSVNAGFVDAVDRDKKAISLAKKRYSKPNVRFYIADVIKELFPRTNYDVVSLFEAIEHFSVEAGTRLLQKIAASLSSTKGTLVGSTPIVTSKGGHNPEHDNEFLSMEQLRLFLEYHFTEVDLWLTKWPTRNACYFICSRPILLSEEKILQAIQQYRGFING